MAHVCYKCHLAYGHPLSWCPGCGRRMVRTAMKQSDWEAIRIAGWKTEGDKGLYEYFLDGKKIETKDSYQSLVLAVKAKHPLLWDVFRLPPEWDGSGSTPGPAFFVRGDRDVTLKFEIKGSLQLYIKSPRLTFRLVGSDLPIDAPEEMFADQPFRGV